MEPTNPLLPALRPDTPALLRRTGSLLGAVHGIQQEASAEYWLGLLVSGSLSATQQASAITKCADLLELSIETALKRLRGKAKFDESRRDDENGQTKYWGVADDDDGGWWAFFNNDFYSDERGEFAKLLAACQTLASLQSSPRAKAQVMLNAAESVRGLVPYEVWAVYISFAFTFDKQIDTLREKLRRTSYWAEKCQVLSEIIANFPSEPEAYFARAKKWEATEKYSDALQDLNVYISLVRTDASAFKLRGRVRNFLGDVAGREEDAIAAQQLGAVLDKAWLDAPEDFL